MSVGDRVRIIDGREGVITALIKAETCRCVTVFVRLARGEWAGHPSEVTVL